MNAATHSAGDARGWRRFLERLGAYLLLGPIAALLTIMLLGLLFDGFPRDASAFGFSVLGSWAAFLPVIAIYFVAVPVAGLYALVIALVLAKLRRVAVWHVVICALLVSAFFYLPVLMLGAPSEGENAEVPYLRVFAFVFLPVLGAGLVCWRVAPALHGNRP